MAAVLDYTTIDSQSVASKATVKNLFTALGNDSFVCDGRLSLTSGTPVTTGDVTAATTVYFVPFGGNRIALYQLTEWKIYTFTQLSLSLAGLAANTNFDIFVIDSGGTPTLTSVAWSGSNTRATGILLADGVYTQSNMRYRYLGTIRTTSTIGQCEDSVTKRFVWNNYNRRLRKLAVHDSTNSWTYSIGAWQQARATSTNKVEVVVGNVEDFIPIQVTGAAIHSASAQPAAVGIGVNVTNATSADISTSGVDTGVMKSLHARALIAPTVGYNYYAWLELGSGSGTTTWYGDDGSSFVKTGLTAEMFG